VTHSDDEAVATKLAERVWRLRVFDDDAGFMNVAAAEAGGEVPRRQPVHALRRHPQGAAAVVDGGGPVRSRRSRSSNGFSAALAAVGARVATGRFAAHMQVELVNDGPVTVMVES